MTNKSLGLTITVRGVQAAPPATERGAEPVYALGPNFATTLVSNYRFDALDSEMFADKHTIVSFPRTSASATGADGHGLTCHGIADKGVRYYSELFDVTVTVGCPGAVIDKVSVRGNAVVAGPRNSQIFRHSQYKESDCLA